MDWTMLLPGGALLIGVAAIVAISRWLGPAAPTRDPLGRKGKDGMDQFQHNRPW